ncbi:monooxygenase [Penicillium macrosclerotiorum]|uniref:monooxygenase n=1 Tax=Penicillium macrosclerotiorum TaxID=303699 RepID=UPI0025492818|nr:monooxygenase [Penicillium macrosclerotiorum]KAJ5668694.1 monooxygenase [Penicillium macrosclerotiorum]
MPPQNLRPCRVLIAGGGVGGLTLALSLEKHGISYLLLEAYPELAPRRGGGIAIMPNGARILDQLGCYDDLRRRAGSVVHRSYLRAPDGTVLATVEDLEKQITESFRHGYPIIWVDRQLLLQTLYDSITVKSTLLTNKRIATVSHLTDGTQVTTTDGSVYTGDILIGADGTHSTVRQAIVERATQLGLGTEYFEEEQIPSTYDCIFGLSPYNSVLVQNPDSEPGSLQFIRGNHYSYVLGTSGPADRTWWFLMINRGITYYGTENNKTQTYDTAAKETILHAHRDDHLTPKVRLADLLKGPTETVYTPLREWVYTKWHLGRLGILGDAAHKMTTTIGQGGNQAIESAAAMTNSLAKALSAGAAIKKLSEQEIDTLLEEFQEGRVPRTRMVMAASRRKQDADAMEALTSDIPKVFSAIYNTTQEEELISAGYQDVDGVSRVGIISTLTMSHMADPEVGIVMWPLQT